MIPGTADGYAPFFSPDGQWIGFFAGGELKKMPLAGGQPVLVTHVPPVNFGATWGSDGRIVYTRAPNGELWWVSESGGDPRRLTRIDSERGEQAHLFPQFIGGSRALLFTVREGRDFQEVNKSSIAVLETATGKQRILLEGARFARFGGGRLVFLRGDAIFSVAFDATRLETIGPVTALGETVATNPVEGFANIDISPEGTLVYLDGPPDSLTLTKVLRLDRTGNERTLELPPAQYYTPRLSPDGRRLALVQHVVGRTEIVVYDRDRDLLSTVTPEAGRFFTPVWSPDGSRLGFSRFHRGNPALCLKRSDGGGDLQALTGPSDDAHFGNSWSPDGTTLAYTTLHLTISERDPARAAFSTDIYLVGTDGRRASRPWFESPFSESAAVFSPDGKSIAYVSDESGTNQVFARAYPDGQNKIQISTGSGMEPVWTRGGGELIYRTGTNNERFMAVSIRSSPGLSTSSPRLLFESDALAGVSPDGYREYDVSEDGNEFFTVRAVNAPDPERRLVVITDWAATQPH